MPLGEWGLVIGLMLIPAGLVIRGANAYFLGMIRIFGLVTATTLATGLIALLAAHVTVTPDTVAEITRYDHHILNDVAIARAGTMHNFSYLGGLLGIMTGSGSIYCQRRGQKRNRLHIDSKA